MPRDFQTLSKKQWVVIKQWCLKVPVVGFNSGCYHVNLIREHFVEGLAGTTQKGRVKNKIMFILRNGLCFLNFVNYMSLGTSYKKWVKALMRDCKIVVSIQVVWHPQKAWFHRVLERRGVVFKAEGRVHSHTGGIQRLWARVCRKEHAPPCRQAKVLQQSLCGSRPWSLGKVERLLPRKEVQHPERSWSIPGVSLHFLLCWVVERGVELYSPGKEAYDMLKWRGLWSGGRAWCLCGTMESVSPTYGATW